MSLEAAIKELNETQLKLLDVTERLLATRTEAIETVKAVAAAEPKGKPATSAPKKTEEVKKADEPKKTEVAEEPKPNISVSPEDRVDPAIAAAEQHPVGKAIVDYVSTGYNEAHPQAAEERKSRSERVKELYAKLGGQIKVEVKSYNDIPEQYHGAVLKKIAELVAEGNRVIKDAPAEVDL